MEASTREESAAGMFHRSWRIAALFVLVAAVSATAARGAASTDPVPLTAGELALREAETASLGAQHAAEHAAMRAATLDGDTASAGPEVSVAAVSTDPAVVGRWTPKFSIPGVAVHAMMLHTGKVLYFTGTTQGRAYLLDPVTRTTRAVHPPRIAEREDEPANIFCAAQSFLDDGTVLVMGGTIGRREGLNTIFTFDPVSETWKRQANMHHGRWYPTQVLLADGRTVVLDGLNEQGEPNVNPQIESYTRDLDFVTLLSILGQTGQPPMGGLYPHTFQMPSGRVLVAGPEPTDSWFFSLNRIGALSWEDAPNPTRHTWGSGVLLPGSTAGSTKVALIGGVDRASLPDTGTSIPLPGVQTFDEANPAAGWTTAPSLNHGRAHHNTVQLPDRSMVTVGGGYGILNGNRRSGDAAIHRNIELYDAATGQWALGPAQDELRTYHSTALLLPDATVMSAGDDGYGGSSNDTAEIYEPPYLFKGPRPSITSAPGSVTYGDSFTVGTSADATKAVLMAPAAVTHANDMSQRNVPLDVTVQSPGSLTVDAPVAPELAPPTYYMLFVLNDQGVPSVAKFIRLKLPRSTSSEPSPPPDTVIDSGPPATTESTSATFEFHSTTANSTFECRLDGGSAEPCSSPWSYPALSEGQHSLEVTAVDAVSGPDPAPATRTWTVEPPADTTPPQTSIDAGPPSTTTSTSASFQFSSSEPGSSFTCRLDSGNWGDCASPAEYAALSTGPHTFQVQATDGAGNADGTPATWEWTVVVPNPGDTTAPETSIVSGPAISTTSTSAGFEFTASEGGSGFVCRIDGGTWTGCTSPTGYHGLASGPHAFDVRATDQAGNTDGTPATWTWTVTVEATPPATVAPPGLPQVVAPLVEVDSTAPVLEVLAKRAVRRRVLVEVACPMEPCRVRAKGKLVIPGAARTLSLAPATADVRSSPETLELRLSRRAWRVSRRALRVKRRVRALVELTALDAAGNASATRRTIRLRG